MKMPIYRDGVQVGTCEVPDSVMQAAAYVAHWLEKNQYEQICGIGPVFALQRQLAAMTAERDAWKNTHDGLRAVYHDIGAALGANMPAQLVNDVARRRMEQLAIATVLVRDQMDEIKRLNVELDQLRGVSK